AGVGGRRGRRHHRLHPGARRRLARRPHAQTHRGGRPPDARRRQHGRVARPPARVALARRGETALRRAVAPGGERGPECQGGAAGGRGPGAAPRHPRRQREPAAGREPERDPHAGGGRGIGARRLLSPDRPHRASDAERAGRAAGAGAALRAGARHHAAPCRLSRRPCRRGVPRPLTGVSRRGRPPPPRCHPAQRRRLQCPGHRRAGGRGGLGLVARCAPIRLLSHGSLDRSVARGAAYYGLVRRGLGRRIGGGAARAYYVGLDAGSGSASELEAGPQVLCLIPRGFEEGERVRIPERTFRLAMEQPVQFPLFSTTADRIDAPGAVVPLGDDLQPLPPLHTILRSADPSVKERRVSIEAGLTEIGTLELSLVSDESDERWRLEFELRGAGRAGRLAVTESMPPRFAEAREAIDRIYGHRPLPVGPKDVKALWRTLEKSLGARETWRVP